MDEQPPVIETPTAMPRPPAMSLLARLLNVFAIPGDTFEDVKSSAPRVSNWLAPSLILAVVGVLSALIIFSQPAIIEKFDELMEKRMNEQVQAGKYTQAQADSAQKLMGKIMTPTNLKIFGSIGAVFSGFVRIFWWALVLWVSAIWFLKVKIPFEKAAEVAGLAIMISVLGMIVTMLLTVNFGKLGSTPSLALAVSDFDSQNKGHLLLAAVNVFSFWQIAVFACGLGRLTSVPFARALFPVLLYWLVSTLFLIGVGAGSLTM